MGGSREPSGRIAGSSATGAGVQPPAPGSYVAAAAPVAASPARRQTTPVAASADQVGARVGSGGTAVWSGTTGTGAAAGSFSSSTTARKPFHRSHAKRALKTISAIPPQGLEETGEPARRIEQGADQQHQT